MPALIIEHCHVASCDPAGHEFPDGHLVVEDGRITAVGPGPAPAPSNPAHADAERIDAAGCLLTPGLVNTHHHLYQWLTRAVSQDEPLFDWLVRLYPVWAGIDAETTHAAAAANLGWLALSGATLVADHHYVFPAGGGDPLAAEIEAAARIGVRFHPARGSMDLGVSHGGLPPDSVVEDRDAILAATAAAIDAHHDPSPDAMVQIAVAPCSPFSVTSELMRESAELARARGVRLHTHLAETVEEDAYCAEHHATTPAGYVESLGWLGDDVWLAHGVQLDAVAIDRLARTGTGVAHCPSSNARLGAGIAPVPELLRAGVPVGLGVDGSASNEHNRLGDELRQAVLVARLRGGAAALTARQALSMATLGGARCLGRDRDLGSLEVGKLADLALWRVDGLAGAGIADPVAALVLGSPALERLWVGGRPVVSDGRLLGADAHELARDAAVAARRVAARAERVGH